MHSAADIGFQSSIPERLKVDLLLEKLDGLLGDMSDRSLLEPPNTAPIPPGPAAEQLKKLSTASALDDLPLQGAPGIESLVSGAQPTERRRKIAGPRRLPELGHGSPLLDEHDGGDIGSQSLHAIPKDVPLAIPEAKSFPPLRPARRFIPIRKRASPDPGSPLFLDALTTLLSSMVPSATTAPKMPVLSEEPVPSIIGLGITQPAITGLGISDVASSLPDGSSPTLSASESPAGQNSGSIYRLMPE